MREHSLRTLYNNMQDCTRCDVCNMECNKKSNGEKYGKLIGNGVLGKIVLVGQNPSYRRFATGAFEGGYGQKFREQLEEIGFNLDECFFTNVVKCSTENNRYPTHEEITNCKDNFMKTEIKLVNPKLIIGMGRIAKDVFHLKDYYSWGEYNGIKAIAINHPSYINYKPAFREEYLKKVKDVWKVYKKEKTRLDEWC